jgi:hypothetical protein
LHLIRRVGKRDSGPRVPNPGGRPADMKPQYPV